MKNHLAITPYFETPVNIQTEIFNIAFKDIVQIEFFKKDKIMIVSGGTPDRLAIYRIEKYLCAEPLTNCGQNPLVYDDCTDGAIIYNGQCRCLSGFYDDYLGKC